MALSKEHFLRADAPRVKEITFEGIGSVFVRTLSTKELLWYQQEAAKHEKEGNTAELVVTNVVAFFGNEDGSRMFTHDEARQAVDGSSFPPYLVTMIVEEGADFNGLTDKAQKQIRGKF